MSAPRRAVSPEVRRLATYFVDELSSRARQLEETFACRDRASIARLASQMHDAARGYGLDELAQAAAEATGAALDENVAALQHAVDELAEMCRLIAAGRSSNDV